MSADEDGVVANAESFSGGRFGSASSLDALKIFSRKIAVNTVGGFLSLVRTLLASVPKQLGRENANH